MKVSVKRIYELPAKSDGFRVLVDRLWPRGISKSDAKLDSWLPDLGPSAALRQWFNHDPAKWTEFCRRYQAELKEKEDLLVLLVKEAQTKPITLLYSAKDERHNQAVALRSVLLKNLPFSQSLVPPKTTAEIASGKKRRKSRSP
ncbi:DUF488 domain-containing protein [Candidatus Nitrospira inopinata]|jgi:uncharacterized protein YeaO (DUF488 family)|uniref:Uroporphyrin-III C-methyltransferase n=1 Tax=Candidatus Nitrospira inopinata TaxID=1715989 RepID=A0A0S4KWS5_9BACT|nr:DUF488 family protein [Candidatus Nitrospira inopinata]CUQ67658.1 conserved protein of unknown function [Candidatus Nitrospira inopinata]